MRLFNLVLYRPKIFVIRYIDTKSSQKSVVLSLIWLLDVLLISSFWGFVNHITDDFFFSLFYVPVTAVVFLPNYKQRKHTSELWPANDVSVRWKQWYPERVSFLDSCAWPAQQHLWMTYWINTHTHTRTLKEVPWHTYFSFIRDLVTIVGRDFKGRNRQCYHDSEKHPDS